MRAVSKNFHSGSSAAAVDDFDAAFVVVVFDVVVVVADVLGLFLTCLSASYTSEDSTPNDVVDDDLGRFLPRRRLGITVDVLVCSRILA